MRVIRKNSVRKTSRIENRALNRTLVSAIRETSFSTLPLCLFFLKPRGGSWISWGVFANFVSEPAKCKMCEIFIFKRNSYRNLGLFIAKYETKFGPSQTKYRSRPTYTPTPRTRTRTRTRTSNSNSNSNEYKTKWHRSAEANTAGRIEHCTLYAQAMRASQNRK